MLLSEMHSEKLTSNSTLTLPRLKSIMQSSDLDATNILYIDDIEILRPNGSVLRVVGAFRNPEDVNEIMFNNVILSRNLNGSWVAKMDRRDPESARQPRDRVTNRVNLPSTNTNPDMRVRDPDNINKEWSQEERRKINQRKLNNPYTGINDRRKSSRTNV
jgi:hypothetical protein